MGRKQSTREPSKLLGQIQYPGILDLALVAGLGLGLGLAPIVASAVGFGKLSVESAIGEPLSVRVPLVSLRPGELEELGIALAAPGWYEASGLEYPDIASELILDLDLSDPAEPAVTVKTLDGINNVAIPIMLELEWPQRVMRRQVTILLNPAGYRSQRPAAQTAADQATEEGAEASGTIGATSPVFRQPLAVDQGQPGSAASGNVARPALVIAEAGDSLSTIVDLYLPDGASRFQGRMAFYDVNADAFRNGDINQVIRGAELTVPTAETILELPAAESRRRYADLLSAARGDGETGKQDADIEAGSRDQPTTAVDDGGLATSGFRLSLLEVAEPVVPDPQSAVTTEGQTASGAVQGADLSPVGPGAEDFAMQGFSMKLTVMNAYIVELQDENRQLKNRVSSLEQKVEQLILRSRQPTDALAAEQVTDQGGVVGGSTEAAIGGDQAFVSEPAVGVLDAAADEGAVNDAAADSVNMVENVAAESVNSDAGTDAGAVDDFPIDGQASELTAVAASQQSLVADGDAPVQEVTVIPGSGEANQAAITEGLGVETTSPRLVYRDGLLQQARQFVQRFNTPLSQLVAAVAAMGLGLLLWMLFRDRKRYRLANEFQKETGRRGNGAGYGSGNDIDYDEEIGVSFTGSNEITQLDMDDDPWVSQEEIGESDLENLPASDVDLITQSEVYLTYDRPVQAIEVLLEEYNKKDGDKFIVATRILRILENMGQGKERDLLLRDFIISLNHDVEEFSAGDWDTLRHDLNALRKAEHQSALEDDSQQQISMDEHRNAIRSADHAASDQPGSDEASAEEARRAARPRSNVEGFGTVELANDHKICLNNYNYIKYVPSDQEEKNDGDDGVVELTYNTRDKAQSR